jgi:predicted AlkP superfamily phosphohydrolase/phosphomutase
MLNYYVDPGSGFVFVQNTTFLWGIILGLLGTFFFFFRLFFKFLKRIFWVFIILLAILIIGGLIMHKPVSIKKVIILGIDGMDPNITEQLMQEGRLPNFSYLKTMGTYSHLKTITPAESVVVWTSFITGLNPGSHGIFDFIMRDPKNYLPYLSLNEISTIQDKIKIQIRRKGLAFWDILSKNRIPSYIYFCPNTFPPEHVLGKMLSGMGVPDITGTMGRFSFYTTKPLSEDDKDTRGKVIHVESKDNIIETEIYGPKMNLNSSTTESTIPLRIMLAPDIKKISLEFQGNRLSLKENSWSNWQRVSFKIGLSRKIYGIVRFYLKSIKPDFELYCSPINFDPRKPPFPISYPNDYSGKLAKRIGYYYTQGMPHDTWALTEDRFNEDAFLEHADIILEERIRILEEELNRFKKGVFFFYFDTLDSIQHMFWRYIDSKHPLYEANSHYKDTIFKYYEKIDQILGDVLKKVDQDTTVMVFSDHGFGPFQRAVHLNRWLLENGYLFLKDGLDESKEFFEDVDWSKTKAYALGFGGIYINKIGREYYGIISEPEAQELKQTIRESLRQFKDPKTGEPVVKNIYLQEEVFQGSYLKDAPDLFVGFNPGFQVSWQTALGGVPKILIEDNNRKWSGDHEIDPSLIPGVIFVNKKIGLKDPLIIDIAPTILGLFNINIPKEIQGKVLFKDETKTK